MNLQLQLAKVEKLSLSAPTKFVMSRLLASAFVNRAREREDGKERESGNERGEHCLLAVFIAGRGWGAAWASRGVDCMTVCSRSLNIYFI